MTLEDEIPDETLARHLQDIYREPEESVVKDGIADEEDDEGEEEEAAQSRLEKDRQELLEIKQ